MKRRENTLNHHSGKHLTDGAPVLRTVLSVLLLLICLSFSLLLLTGSNTPADEKEPDGILRIGVIDGPADLTHDVFSGLVNTALCRKVNAMEDGSFSLEALTDEELTGGDETYAGHGTAVAGMIAEQLSGYGLAGKDVEIIYVQAASSEDKVSAGAAVSALDYLKSLGVKVVNMSLALTGDAESTALKEACDSFYRSGGSIVCAAGNDGSTENVIPADYASTISVIALDADDERRSDSNYGEKKDLSACGTDILCPAPGNARITCSGTSAAAPSVSAAALLLYAENRDLTPSQVRTILTASARDIGADGYDAETGWGCLDVDAMLQYAENASGEDLLTDISGAEVTMTESFAFTGQEIRPVLTVRSGRLLEEGFDYSVSYENNIHAGTASLTISACEGSSYRGSATRTYEITPLDINRYITVKSEILYTGEPIEDAAYETWLIVKDQDYTVSFENNTEVGTARIIFRGIGDFTGSLETTFQIIEKSKETRNNGKASTDGSAIWTFDGVDTLTIKPQDGIACFGVDLIPCLEEDITNGYVSPDIYDQVKHIVIRKGVYSLNGGFCGFTKAETLSIPDTLGLISGSLFGQEGNDAITSLSLPDREMYLDGGTFANMRALKSFSFPASFGEEIPGGIFFGCISLESVVFPENLKTIGGSAFANCAISEISLPETVTKIGEGAFSGCPIESIEFPGKLTSLSGFDNTKLKSVTIPSTVKTIEKMAFMNTPLTSLTIQDGVELIRQSAFEGTALTSVSLPDSVNCLEDFAFYTRTLSSASLPAGLKGQVGERVFWSDTKVNYRGDEQSSGETDLSSISGSCGESAFYTLSEDGKLEITGSGTVSGIYFGRQSFAAQIRSVSFADGITGIAESTFAGCPNLNIIYLNQVTSIGDGAFLNCKNLTDILQKDILSDQAVRPSVGRYAFYGCGFKMLTLKFARVGSFAFAECDDLQSGYISAQDPSDTTYLFYGCDSLKWSMLQSPSMTIVPEGFFALCPSLYSLGNTLNVKTAEAWSFYGSVLPYLPWGIVYKEDALSGLTEMPESFSSERTIAGVVGSAYDLTPYLTDLEDPEILIENEAALHEGGDGTLLLSAPGTVRVCIKDSERVVKCLTFVIGIPSYADMAEVYRDAQKVQYDSWGDGEDSEKDSPKNNDGESEDSGKDQESGAEDGESSSEDGESGASTIESGISSGVSGKTEPEGTTTGASAEKQNESSRKDADSSISGSGNAADDSTSAASAPAQTGNSAFSGTGAGAVSGTGTASGAGSTAAGNAAIGSTGTAEQNENVTYTEASAVYAEGKSGETQQTGSGTVTAAAEERSNAAADSESAAEEGASSAMEEAQTSGIHVSGDQVADGTGESHIPLLILIVLAAAAGCIILVLLLRQAGKRRKK